MSGSAVSRAVVAFAGARDGYQLPWALAEADLLEELVTDVYFPLQSRFWRQLLERGLRIQPYRRYCQGVPWNRVTMSALSAAGFVAEKVTAPGLFSSARADAIG